MGGGPSKSSTFNFDSFRLSFLGYFVKLPDTADVLGKFKPHTLACLARVDAAQHKIFVVTDGAVEVCVCPLAPGAIRTVRPVDVSTLHSGCRTLSPGSLFLSCGDGNAEIVCVSSAASKVLSLSADSWGDAAAAAPALEEFAKTDFSTILQNAEMFQGLSSRELNLIGSLLELHRIHPGEALTQRGRAGNESVPACAVFLSGELLEISEGSNYIYPLSQHSLHATVADKLARRMSVAPRTTCAELELDDIAQIAGGFRSLARGEVVGANLCFFPGFEAPSTIVAREKSLVGILRRDSLLKLEKVLGVPLEKRMRPAALLGMLNELKSTNVLLRVLTPAESMKTAEGCRIQTLEKGQRIVKETEEVHSFYVLKSGSVSVAAGSSSRKGAAYASQKDSVFDRLYPFSMYSPASNLTETESTSAASRKQSSKLPVLSAARNFLFPIASSIAPMSSGYTVTALVPASANVSKVSILEIPQKVLDEAVFQAPFEADSTANISSAVDDVDFIHVLRHSAGFNHLHDYLRNERSTEGIYFWKAVERYSILMSRFEISVPVTPPEEFGTNDPFEYVALEASDRLKAAQEIAITIIEHYVNNDSFFQVNIPHTLRNAIITTYSDLNEKTTKLISEVKHLKSQDSSQDKLHGFIAEYNAVLQEYGSVFVKAKQEVYLLMREDSFKRWRRTEGFSRFIMDVLNKK